MAAGAVLALCLAGGARAQADGTQAGREAAFERVVRESNDCLAREVAGRVGTATLALTDAERAAIRTAVADACHIYNAQLARFTREVNEGTRSLEDVTAAMLDGSLQLADQLIDVRLEENAKARGK